MSCKLQRCAISLFTFTKTYPTIRLLCIASLSLCLLSAPTYGEDNDTSSMWSVSPTFFHSLLNFTEYNRVEGAFLGSELIITNRLVPRTMLIARGGYGLKSKEWRYAAELIYTFDELSSKTLSLAYFNETRSNDSWIFSRVENILSTVILRKDFRDYFQTRGVESRLIYNYSENFGFVLELGYREYNSMNDEEPWSLFYGNKDFLINPAVSKNNEILLAATVSYSTRDDLFIESNFWQMDLKFEREFHDFTFTGAHFNLRRMQLGFRNQTLIAALRGGFREGTVAEQYLLDLGGFGSMRAYDFKEFTGTRELFIECNYLFNGDLLQRIPLQFIPLYSSLATGIFFDAGLNWFTNDDRKSLLTTGISSGGRETGNRFRNIKSGAGISLFLLDGAFKINCARRFDRSKNAWEITFRFRLFQNL